MTSKDPQFDQLLEIRWQRPLTALEEARLTEYLAAHPESQAAWDEESELSRALENLTTVPVSNNFTSRVLNAAQRTSEAREAGPNRQTSAWYLRWLPRTALAAVVLAAGLLSYHHVQEVRREEVARSLTALSSIPSLPDPQVLKDFDAIAALGSTPSADEELLKVMQ